MKKLYRAAIFAVISLMVTVSTVSAQEIYEWRIYHDVDAGRLNRYMQEVLIPAYNRQQVKVGAYSEYSMSTPARQYYLFVYADPEAYWIAQLGLRSDQEYLRKAAEDDPANPAYSSYDTYLCEAFTAWPHIDGNNKGGILEWRMYESANEDAGRRKVKMFNSGEIDIFVESGIKPFFFGQLLAGPNMPALMYITRFEDMAERDKAWNAFGANPKWKTMSALPEYVNSMNVNNRRFLIPLPYSQ